MPKKKLRRRPAKKRSGNKPKNPPCPEEPRLNLLACGCYGCHIVDESTPWILGCEGGVLPLTASEAAAASDDDEHYVELELLRDGGDAGGPPVGVLAVSNRDSASTRVAYVSLAGARAGDVLTLLDGLGERLSVGRTSWLSSEAEGGSGEGECGAIADSENAGESGGESVVVGGGESNGGAGGELVACVTFVVLVPPLTAIYMARTLIADSVEFSLAQLSFPLRPHPDPDGARQATTPRLAQFPLRGNGPFLCTQGFGGRLTHFFPESYHAVDFRCDEGTEVLAVADGVVIEVEQACHYTGIHLRTCNPPPNAARRRAAATYYAT